MTKKFSLGQEWVSKVTNSNMPEVSVVGADIAERPCWRCKQPAPGRANCPHCGQFNSRTPLGKTRYLLGPHEESDQPVALMGLQSAIDTLKAYFEDENIEPGDEIVFKVVELTEDEVNALPEL